MPKTALAVQRAIEKQRPIYKAVHKVLRWYQDHPHTAGATAGLIRDLHTRADQEQEAMDRRHAEELLPILQRVEQAQKDARTLAEKHRGEKEGLTIAFANCEMQILKKEITELPTEFAPVDSSSPLWIKLGLLIASKIQRILDVLTTFARSHNPWRTKPSPQNP